MIDNTRGLLEIYYEGRWGTVCDDGIQDSAMHDEVGGVACRQLGFASGTAITTTYRGEENQPIFLDDIVCDGDETRLIDCDHQEIGVHNCLENHIEDVGVDCEFLEDDDANLFSLSLSGIQIGTFLPDMKSYGSSVGYSVTQTAVSAVAADRTATVDISPDPSVNLRVGANIITVTVTTADRTRNVYTVTVTRAHPPPETVTVTCAF